MLVGLGDLPKPDQDVLSSTIFANGASGVGKDDTNNSGGVAGVGVMIVDNEKSNTTLAPSEASDSTSATSSSVAAGTSSPLRITADYPTGVPAHKPPGSPRIAPDQLPPHLQRLAALKHSRPASSDSLAAAGDTPSESASVDDGANGASNSSTFLSGTSSQKQQKKRVKVGEEDNGDTATLMDSDVAVSAVTA